MCKNISSNIYQELKKCYEQIGSEGYELASCEKSIRGHNLIRLFELWLQAKGYFV